MSEKYFEILRRCRPANYIPAGRQLPRTPPLKGVRKHLDFSDEEEDNEATQQQNNKNDPNPAAAQNKEVDYCYMESNSDPPHPMLKGMKGYQVTADDLDFLKRMKEEQLVKKLRVDLEELQSQLTNETLALELTCRSKEKEEAELSKFLSCETVAEGASVVLRMSSPATALADVDAKSLLSSVTVKTIQKATAEKRKGLALLQKALSKKRKREAEEHASLMKETANQQMKIQELMRQLSDLKSELLKQQELFKSLEMQSSVPKTSEDRKKVQVPEKRPGRGKEVSWSKEEQSKPVRRKQEEKGAAAVEERKEVKKPPKAERKGKPAAPEAKPAAPKAKPAAPKAKPAAPKAKPASPKANEPKKSESLKTRKGKEVAKEEDHAVVPRRSKRILNRKGNLT